MQYTIVQHSGFGYTEKPAFKQGLEMRSVTEKQANELRELGAVVFNSYSDADDFCDSEMFPEGAQGINPQAPGSFLQKKIDGLRVYIPKEHPDELDQHYQTKVIDGVKHYFDTKAELWFTKEQLEEQSQRRAKGKEVFDGARDGMLAAKAMNQEGL